jgi:hypothetical protein
MIQPAPITCLFTILPKLDPTLTHHSSYNSLSNLSQNNAIQSESASTTALATSTPLPIPNESIITNPILPPIAMLRFLRFGAHFLRPAPLADCVDAQH